MQELLKHLIITEVVEIGIAYLLGIRDNKNILLIFIINMITNIPLNIILMFVVTKQVLYLSGYTGINIFTWYYIIVAVLEIAILFIEALFFYKKINIKKGCVFYKQRKNFYTYILFSLILNISSIIVGRIFEIK